VVELLESKFLGYGNYLKYELMKRGGKVDKNEFMGSIAVNYGIRRKTQEEYLENLNTLEL